MTFFRVIKLKLEKKKKKRKKHIINQHEIKKLMFKN